MFIFETLAVVMFFPLMFVLIKRMCGSGLKIVNWSFDEIDGWLKRLIKGKDSQ